LVGLVNVDISVCPDIVGLLMVANETF